MSMRTKDRGKARPQGQIRQSQVVTTFGPGAMVDLPDHAVLIGGLDDWTEGRTPVSEDRLIASLKRWLDLPRLRLYTPPAATDDPAKPRTGITAWQFPEWFVAPYEIWGDDRTIRSRPLVPRGSLNKGRYLNREKKLRPVQPVRFVQACINGHISDIDWLAFVHRMKSVTCTRRTLWLDERGTSGELRDIIVRCECGAARSMAEAAQRGADGLGYCDGSRPWLGRGPGASEKCGGEGGKPEPNKLLIRSASNAYFAQTISVISIPDDSEEVKKVVDQLWDDFCAIESMADLAHELKKPKIKNALEGMTPEAVFDEIARRNSGATTGGTAKSIKAAEIEVLLDSPPELGEDRPEGDFYARRLELPATSVGPLALVDRVVLIHRLREVSAQVGFTRFEAAIPDIEGDLKLDVRRAALARETEWLPAVEIRGEGVLIAFKESAIDSWLNGEDTKQQGQRLLAGFDAWTARTPATAKPEFPGLAYLMLHSLAHLLITSVSLECGYAASAVKERIYATAPRYAILLYTGTPDAEGTMGGLVQIGHRIAQHLESALELGRLCSNDPVCAQHHPANAQEERFLHGAACHGCLLIAEPSCERRNEYLDRALVVPTVEAIGAEFFLDMAP